VRIFEKQLRKIGTAFEVWEVAEVKIRILKGRDLAFI
jgi:hypothetical protein